MWVVSKSDYSADDMAAMRNTESSTPGKMLQYATQLRETQRLDVCDGYPYTMAELTAILDEFEDENGGRLRTHKADTGFNPQTARKGLTVTHGSFQFVFDQTTGRMTQCTHRSTAEDATLPAVALDRNSVTVNKNESDAACTVTIDGIPPMKVCTWMASWTNTHEGPNGQQRYKAKSDAWKNRVAGIMTRYRAAQAATAAGQIGQQVTQQFQAQDAARKRAAMNNARAKAMAALGAKRQRQQASGADL